MTDKGKELHGEQPYMAGNGGRRSTPKDAHEKREDMHTTVKPSHGRRSCIRMPTVGQPTGTLLDGRLPDGRLPDGRLPNGRLQNGRLTHERSSHEKAYCRCLSHRR